ncbi:hypothetical protein K443DRAFT_296621 [Laccaria amethystina LaAM-08-1]|uniref:Uncharacterized protein n=1 Tax=Laccaria amethystina LaAM-08-1 TaxID=1095629 RepID=A0A0C9WUR1_9AGAR|nr:hypothetical protein K443DRAFT_296621 [Laccaria amethystina LaAM-08-1]
MVKRRRSNCQRLARRRCRFSPICSHLGDYRAHGLVPSKVYRAPDICMISIWKFLFGVSWRSSTCVYLLLVNPMTSRLLSMLPLSGTIQVRTWPRLLLEACERARREPLWAVVVFPAGQQVVVGDNKTRQGSLGAAAAGSSSHRSAEPYHTARGSSVPAANAFGSWGASEHWYENLIGSPIRRCMSSEALFCTGFSHERWEMEKQANGGVVDYLIVFF